MVLPGAFCILGFFEFADICLEQVAEQRHHRWRGANASSFQAPNASGQEATALQRLEDMFGSNETSGGLE